MNKILQSPRGAWVLANIARRCLRCKACHAIRMQLGHGLITEKDLKDQKKMAEFGELMFNNSCEECQTYVTVQLEKLIGKAKE